MSSVLHRGSLIPLWVNVGGLTDCPRIVAVADHRSPIGTREANESAQAVAKRNLLAYVNCDILLFQDFRAATETTAARRVTPPERNWAKECRESGGLWR